MTADTVKAISVKRFVCPCSLLFVIAAFAGTVKFLPPQKSSGLILGRRENVPSCEINNFSQGNICIRFKANSLNRDVNIQQI